MNAIDDAVRPWRRAMKGEWFYQTRPPFGVYLPHYARDVQEGTRGGRPATFIVYDVILSRDFRDAYDGKLFDPKGYFGDEYVTRRIWIEETFQIKSPALAEYTLEHLKSCHQIQHFTTEVQRVIPDNTAEYELRVADLGDRWRAKYWYRDWVRDPRRGDLYQGGAMSRHLYELSKIVAPEWTDIEPHIQGLVMKGLGLWHCTECGHVIHAGEMKDTAFGSYHKDERLCERYKQADKNLED